MTRIDQRHDQWIMLIDLDELPMLSRIVARPDQTRQFVRLLQMADKEIGDQGCGVRHKGSLVIARLLGQPEEIPRVFEGFGELAIDQLSQSNTPQDRSFLANSPVICAKFECSAVGLI